MKFEILIPTYNRCKDLMQNLEYLRYQLTNYELTEQFGIAVSDNASSDDTWIMLQQLKDSWKNEVQLSLLKNETNIGLEQNTVNLLMQSTAEYIIWLGDDDLLAEGYLPFINEHFADEKIGWMIPGLVGIDKYGNKRDGRPENFSEKVFTAGYDTVLSHSHLAHQMSGLVVKREGLAEVYLCEPSWRNPYLFIFFIAYSQFLYDGIYAPVYKTAVNNYNPKDWGYNNIGLLDEVFKSYYYLKDKIGQRKLNRLLHRFLLMHSYRINFNEGFGHVMRQGFLLSKNTPEAKGFWLTLFTLLTKEYLVRKLKKGQA